MSVNEHQNQLDEALAAFNRAVADDPADAAYAVSEVGKAFSRCLRDLSVRIAMIEDSLKRFEQTAPVLEKTELPHEPGLRVPASAIKWFWIAVALLSLAAAAGGFAAGRLIH